MVYIPYKQVCSNFLTRMFVESLYDFSVYIELKEGISFFFFLSILARIFWLMKLARSQKIKATR